jgi:hypothetical protein
MLEFNDENKVLIKRLIRKVNADVTPSPNNYAEKINISSRW